MRMAVAQRVEVTELGDCTGSSRKAVGISEEVWGHITETLTTFYADPEYATAREVIINGVDACVEAGVEPRIDITLSGAFTSSNECVFTDHGIGMTYAILNNVFSEYGFSTKRDSDILTGGYGYGAKTPYTLSDTWTVVSERDGERTLGVFTRAEDNTGEFEAFEQEPTGQSGTTVTIPLTNTNRSAVERGIRRAALFLPSNTVWLNGHALPSIFDDCETLEGDTGYLVDSQVLADAGIDSRQTAILLMGGICYELTNITDVPIQRSWHAGTTLVLNAPIERYVPTPQRDSIKNTPETRARLTEDIERITPLVVKHYQDKLDAMSYKAAASEAKNTQQAITRLVGEQPDLTWNGLPLNRDVTLPAMRGFFKMRSRAREHDELRLTLSSATDYSHFDRGLVVLVGMSEDDLNIPKVKRGINALTRLHDGTSFIMLDEDEVFQKEWVVLGGPDSLVPTYTKEQVLEAAPAIAPRAQRTTRPAVTYTVTIDGRDGEYTASEVKEAAADAERDGRRVLVIGEDEYRLHSLTEDDDMIITLRGSMSESAMLRRAPNAIIASRDKAALLIAKWDRLTDTEKETVLHDTANVYARYGSDLGRAAEKFRSNLRIYSRFANPVYRETELGRRAHLLTGGFDEQLSDEQKAHVRNIAVLLSMELSRGYDNPGITAIENALLDYVTTKNAAITHGLLDNYPLLKDVSYPIRSMVSEGDPHILAYIEMCEQE